MLIEFDLNDESIENPILTKKEYDMYDLDKCYIEVMKKINEFINKQIEYPEYSRVIIKNNFIVRYECYVPKKNDKVGDTVEKKMTIEEEIKELNSDITRALGSMCKDEFTYFIECLYHKRKEIIAIELLDTTRYLLQPIKNSCIIKLASALNVLQKVL